MGQFLLPYLPAEAIRAALRDTPGQESENGKLAMPASSAALAANTFGLFLLHRAHELPVMPGFTSLDWPARKLELEVGIEYPWPSGRNPPIDVLIYTERLLIGVDSRRYEPFRPKIDSKFADAFWRPNWGAGMQPFERMRDRLAQGQILYRHLDAVQLVKHAFALSTEAKRTGRAPVLYYLYADPAKWPDGRTIYWDARKRHCAEIEHFAYQVQGADVRVVSCSYKELLADFDASPLECVRLHATAIRNQFSLERA